MDLVKNERWKISMFLMKLPKISRSGGDGSCEECHEEDLNVPDEASENPNGKIPAN